MTSTQPVQTKIPGFLGMAVYTDCAYLRAFHARGDHLRGLSVSSLELHLFTLNFARLIDCLRASDWKGAEDLVVAGLDRLQEAGASFGVVTSNTGSSLAEAAQDRVQLPLLSITDVTCSAAARRGVGKLGLLSTIRTCETGTYHRAGDRHGIEIVDPDRGIAAGIERLIFDELISGVVSDRGLEAVRDAVRWFAKQGCEGVALACTDITHLVAALEGTTDLPIFDSTVLHAAAAADAALGQVGA